MTNACCDVLKRYAEEYPATFEMSENIFDVATGELYPPAWILRMYKYTKRRRVAFVGRSWAYMTYCPFCGRKLRDE